MKWRQLIILFAILFLSSQPAYGQAPLRPSSAQGFGRTQQSFAGQTKTAAKPAAPAKNKKIDKKINELDLKKPKRPSNWSHLLELFKFRDLSESKVYFETGLSFYTVSYSNWNFRRFEPFVKLRWALLDKYLSLYTIFSTDFSTINYKLSDFKIGKNDISFTVGMQSSKKHTFGGGIQILLIGWKKLLSLRGYAQTQSTSISSASLESAVLSINNNKFDLFEQIKGYVDITYAFERYDCGAILSFQPFKWFTLSTTAGYIWLNAEIKLSIKQELGDVIQKALGAYYNDDIVPDHLTINQASGFASLGMKFKLYRRFHLNLEGAFLPAKNPIYYGQLSLSIE